MSRSIPALLAVALLAPAAVATTAAGAAPATPALLSCSGTRLVRPAGTVVLSCADANSELRSTSWQSWSASGARGVTDFGINLCTPTCVASRIRFFPDSTIKLSGATHTSKGLLFTRAVITYMLDGKRRTFIDSPPTKAL